MEENRFLKQAKEELAYLSDDPDFQLIVDARVRMLRDIYSFRKQCEREANEKVEKELKEKREEGRAEGRTEGRMEGEKHKQKEIAQKMKLKNVPVDEIIELTGLIKDEIETL